LLKPSSIGGPTTVRKENTMATQARVMTDETEIRNALEEWAEALRAKNVDGVLAFYTPDVRAFDAAPPLEHDREAMRRGLEEWFPSWRGPIGYEFRDLRVTASADVAFGTSLVRLTGERTDGEATDVWMRSTVCLRMVGGWWIFAHVHLSVPFAMDGSYRALVDLKPQ
jgi:PhnB protein